MRSCTRKFLQLVFFQSWTFQCRDWRSSMDKPCLVQLLLSCLFLNAFLHHKSRFLTYPVVWTAHAISVWTAPDEGDCNKATLLTARTHFGLSLVGTRQVGIVHSNRFFLHQWQSFLDGLRCYNGLSAIVWEGTGVVSKVTRTSGVDSSAVKRRQKKTLCYVFFLCVCTLNWFVWLFFLFCSTKLSAVLTTKPYENRLFFSSIHKQATGMSKNTSLKCSRLETSSNWSSLCWWRGPDLLFI